MFFRILKKDLKRKKGINFIVFLFMTMATLFVASSVNNIFVVMNATEYCLEKGKVPDVYICAYQQPDERKIEEWLEENECVKEFSVNKATLLTANNITGFNDKKGEDYDIGNSIMLQGNWTEHMLLFDREGNPIELQSGEIAMTKKEMDRNHLKVGDTFSIGFGEYNKTFVIQNPIRDLALGSDLVGMSRYLISESDFEEVEKYCDNIQLNYGVNTTDNDQFIKDFNKQAYNIVISLEKNIFEYSYVMSLIMAAILIVLGVCLIVISFLVLRFTIVFTLGEEYKEIGIMKAVGIKNFTIKKTYLVKYFALISVASVLGCIISVPVSDISLKLVTDDMLLKNGKENLIINIICALVVMAIVMLLCLLSTNRLKRFSAMEAIRNGTTGERFHRKAPISLKRARHMSSTLFLAVNDILSEVKKYVVLILTFAMGTILIILSLNTLTSITSKEMAKNFALDTEADIYVSADTAEDGEGKNDSKYAEKSIAAMKQEMKKAGYDTEISTLAIYSLGFNMEDSDDVFRFMISQPVGSDGTYIELTKGYSPILENEIAMSEQAMKKMGAKIGDTICMKIGTKSVKMIITASYANYMQMGESVILNPNFDVGNTTLAGLFVFQIKLLGVQNKEAAIRSMREEFPQYKFYNMEQAISDNLGGITDMFDGVRMVIVLLVCGINIMITVLMVKIFIMGEKGQIAMLRSIGFSIKQLKWRQMFRIGILLIISTLLGIFCSTFLNTLIIRPIFAMMGALYMKIQVDVMETYIFYPLLLFVVTCVTAYISAGSLKRLKIMEINSME